MPYVVVGEKENGREARSATDAQTAARTLFTMVDLDFMIVAVIDVAGEQITAEELTNRAQEERLRQRIS